jgi:thiol:disulfide interchange protein DsbD
MLVSSMKTLAAWRAVPGAMLLAMWLAIIPFAPAHAQEPVLDWESAVSVRAVAARSTVRPGDQVPLAVVIEHEEGFHTWPNSPIVPPQFDAFVPIPTTIEAVSLPPGARLGEVQWPPVEPVTVEYTDAPVDLLSYVGTSVAFLPLQLDPEQPIGQATVTLSVRFQSCDDRICYPPRTVELAIPLEVVAADLAAELVANEPELFAGFGIQGFRPDDVGGTGRSATYTIPAYINVFGWNFSFEPTGPTGLGLLLLLAAIGGLLLNVTPCVLPIIPIKILGLSKAAGDPGRLKLLGIVMSLGVVSFWLVLGGAIAFISGFDAISSLFQTGWFSPLVGLIVGLAGLGMLGLFSVRLPQAVYRIDPSQDTIPGSFGFGVMTAVLATPCTAPFMAGASAWATLQPSPVTLGTFAAIGAGMALPYLLLTLHPGLVNRIPRTGPGSQLVKQVMGLLMLAVAAFFIGSAVSAWLQSPPEPPSRLYWWVVAGFVAAAFAWLLVRITQIGRRGGPRTIVQVVSLALIVLTLSSARGLASHGPIDWVYYTPERFDEAVAAGDVIVVDFTAEWCLNCKALEASVLHTDRVVALFEAPDVIPMRVDLTTDNPPGQALLQELEWVGIPLLAVYGPGRGYSEPLRFDSYTIAMVEDAVAETRGGRPTARESR